MTPNIHTDVRIVFKRGSDSTRDPLNVHWELVVTMRDEAHQEHEYRIRGVDAILVPTPGVLAEYLLDTLKKGIKDE